MGQVRGLTPHIRKFTGIPKTNLRRRQDMITEDPHWRPRHTDHGCHRHIFSHLEELSVVSFIWANFVEPGLSFTDSDFREVEINAFCNRLRIPMRLLRFSARADSSLPSQHVIICLRGRFATNAGQL
jgi:hypothetical protein